MPMEPVPNAAMSGPMKLLLGHPTLFCPLICLVMPAVSGSGAAMLKTTLAFTMAQGSGGCNVLPEEAYVIGEIVKGDEGCVIC